MNRTILSLLLLAALAGVESRAQAPETPPAQPVESSFDRQLAARFTPIFHQRLTPQVSTHRFDYITRFDFDGDWLGTNNWEHAADPKYPLRAYIYYSVVETETHYFISYSLFHPRDWSLEQPLYEQSLERLKEKLGVWFPQSVREAAEFNHENDLEGLMVIVRKTDGPAGGRLEAVETLAHNRFYKYLAPGSRLSPNILPDQMIESDGDHPIVYVESQKHGIKRYEKQDRRGGPVLIYRYTGTAEEPKPFPGDVAYAPEQQEIGYDLLPLYDAFWAHAREAHEPNDTFGEIYDFGNLVATAVSLLGGGKRQVDCALGRIGVALHGEVAGKNKARMPWGWFDTSDHDLKMGDWFLDPAKALVIYFPRARGVSRRYISNPFLGIFREGAR